MMCDFGNYVNNILANKGDPNANILQGYTTFLLSQKYNQNNIQDYRMKWFVNGYIDYSNIDTTEYYNYFRNNIQDNYSIPLKQCVEKLNDDTNHFTYDEIKMHYDELDARYKDILNMAKPKSTDDENEDYVSVISMEDSNNEELEYQSSMDFYEDYDYEDDYCSQSEYYEEDDYDY